jgi:periplasmic protein TorT
MKMKKSILIVLLALGSLFAQNIEMNSYYGQYDVKTKKASKIATSLGKVKKENWTFEKKANKKYKIAVFFPHIKDSYFLAVNYGIFKEAQRLGVKFDLFEAGGYNNFGNQKRAFLKALKSDYDGIILASISYNKLNEDIAKAKIPVIEVINDIEAEKISAKSLVSFFDMGYKAGNYLIKEAKGKSIDVAFLPGPRNSGWADDTYYGFMQAIKDSNAKHINTHLPLFGDTGVLTQKGLIKRAFHKYKNIDYIVANAVAASVGPDVLTSINKTNTKIISTYLVPEVYKLIQEGKIVASPSDMTVTQGMIALDMMVKILNGKRAGYDFAFRSGPNIPIITKDNLLHYESMFGMKNFKAVFSNR